MRKINLELYPHPKANSSERWTLLFFIGKAIECDDDLMRLRFVEKFNELNASIDQRWREVMFAFV